MTNLEERRVRGDMITTYRIMTGKGKVDHEQFFSLKADGLGPRTRGVTGELRAQHNGSECKA